MSNEAFLDGVKHELLCEEQCVDIGKDILIVVRNQLDHLQACLDSIYRTTACFHLYIWDNDSDEDVKQYLREQAQKWEVDVYFHDCNDGFIKPNNRLLEMGSSPYVILLNSDTIVYSGWDRAMIGYLQQHRDVKEVGYLGGRADESGRCAAPVIGGGADYVMGWCACMPRALFENHMLFDEENLKFAYGEDSDLSFRIREAGYNIHALHVQHVEHVGNATVREVWTERDLSETYLANLEYLRGRWGELLCYTTGKENSHV